MDTLTSNVSILQQTSCGARSQKSLFNYKGVDNYIYKSIHHLKRLIITFTSPYVCIIKTSYESLLLDNY